VTKKAYTKLTCYEIGNRKVRFRGGIKFCQLLGDMKKSKLEISNFSVSRKRLKLDFIQKQFEILEGISILLASEGIYPSSKVPELKTLENW